MVWAGVLQRTLVVVVVVVAVVGKCVRRDAMMNSRRESRPFKEAISRRLVTKFWYRMVESLVWAGDLQ
jgi:hypothetical protein